jgi:hypothetical protein
VLLESALTLQGPFSPSADCIELYPGPPPNQMPKGASLGSFLDSKNQKKVLMGYSGICVSKSEDGREMYPLKDFTPGVVSHMCV